MGLLDILAEGRSDIHCKIKETLPVRELKPTLDYTVSSKKIYLYEFKFMINHRSYTHNLSSCEIKA